MPKHIPGNPNIIIQNVAGAAGLIGTNQVYNIAKPDGLTLGAIYPALYFEQLAKRPEAKFDWTKFIWIGSTVSSNSHMYMRADTPYKTIEDVRTASTPPKCGATGVTSSAYYMPKLLEEAIGAKFEVVSGYVAGPGYRPRRRARRSSVPGVYDQRLSSPASRSLLGARKISSACSIRPAASADRGSRTCRCSTNLMDKYKTPENVRRLTKVVVAADEFGRPIVFPPGVPADRVKIIRDAFNKTINDPALLGGSGKTPARHRSGHGRRARCLSERSHDRASGRRRARKENDRHVIEMRDDDGVQKFKGSSVQGFRTRLRSDL